jgi:cysteine synthase B
MMVRLAKEEAIFAGVSSGGCMAAAVRLAKTLDSGVIVAIVCDRGDRYLSSNVFANRMELNQNSPAKV